MNNQHIFRNFTCDWSSVQLLFFRRCKLCCVNRGLEWIFSALTPLNFRCVDPKATDRMAYYQQTKLTSDKQLLLSVSEASSKWGKAAIVLMYMDSQATWGTLTYNFYTFSTKYFNEKSPPIADDKLLLRGSLVYVR